MKQFAFSMIATVLSVLISLTDALAAELNVRWTNEVGAIIKVLRVEAGAPDSGFRLVKFTYETVKPCKQLSVYGHSYSKDDIQLPLFGLSATKSNVPQGQKFRDQAIVTYEPGHYLVLDKVHCF